MNMFAFTCEDLPIFTPVQYTQAAEMPMKLTIYAHNATELSNFLAIFYSKYEQVNFKTHRDTWSMMPIGESCTIPWREGHHKPNPNDPNRRQFYQFIEI